MKRTLLVIMPSEAFKWTAEKRQVIQKVCQELGWILKIPDYDRFNPDFDLPSMERTLKTVDLVLADLSHERPSCYYELGLAEAVGKKIICVAASGTEIHQTSLRDSVMFFSDLSEFARILHDALH